MWHLEYVFGGKNVIRVLSAEVNMCVKYIAYEIEKVEGDSQHRKKWDENCLCVDMERSKSDKWS